ncbi:unnamed protein product [Soboliphyme baturini]|uniref:Integron gene cassette protein n=1 Tax=Soboliphyme baturini TaxID=241478 RepID=A0A183IJP9_9BILA|nr:unnamed protein product [Soboliphyme baturini]
MKRRICHKTGPTRPDPFRSIPFRSVRRFIGRVRWHGDGRASLVGRYLRSAAVAVTCLRHFFLATLIDHCLQAPVRGPLPHQYLAMTASPSPFDSKVEFIAIRRSSNSSIRRQASRVV